MSPRPEFDGDGEGADQNPPDEQVFQKLAPVAVGADGTLTSILQALEGRGSGDSDAALEQLQQYLASKPGSASDVTNLDATSKAEIVALSTDLSAVGDVVAGATFTVTGTTDAALTGSDTFEGRALHSAAATTFTTLQTGARYEIATLGNLSDAAKTAIVNASDLTANSQVVVGAVFTASSNVSALDTNKIFTGKILTSTGVLTSDIEAVQSKINTARVQAGSQYAAIESAVNYTTDLTAQYELGYNTVNDVNFSMETAHLAKNQILQQAATAMLAQANSGQQGLLQLIS